MSANDAPTDQPLKTPETRKEPDKTFWGTFLKIFGFFTFGGVGFLITPYMQVGDDLIARFIYAFMAITLYLFVLLLIYLYAYKEELGNQLLNKIITWRASGSAVNTKRQKHKTQLPQTIIVFFISPILSILVWLISLAFTQIFSSISTPPSFSITTNTANILLSLLTPSVILMFLSLIIKLTILKKENIEKHKKDFKKSKKNKKIQETTNTTHTPLDQVKYLISLSPAIISISFILVVAYYKDALGNNIELALQITALKLPQNQQTWIAETFLLITIMYLTILPGIALLPSSKFGAHLVFNDKTVQQYESWDALYICTCIQLAIFSFPSAVLLCFIFKSLDGDSAVLYLSGSVTFSFSLGQISIGYSMLKTIKSEKTISLRKIPADKQNLFLLLAITVILAIPALSGITYIQTTYQRMGKLIADPGNINTNSESPYSCVFSGNRKNPEPKAFGIIISSNTSSVHIFSPSFNQEGQKYEPIEDNRFIPTKRMTETHVEIKDYYIENYDKSRHYYNEKTGLCEYKSTK